MRRFEEMFRGIVIFAYLEVYSGLWSTVNGIFMGNFGNEIFASMLKYSYESLAITKLII